MNTVSAKFEHPGKLAIVTTLTPDSDQYRKALEEVYKNFQEGHEVSTDVTATFVNQVDNDAQSQTFRQPVSVLASLIVTASIQTDAHIAATEAAATAAAGVEQAAQASDVASQVKSILDGLLPGFADGVMKLVTPAIQKVVNDATAPLPALSGERTGLAPAPVTVEPAADPGAGGATGAA